MKYQRSAIAALALSAAGLVHIAIGEGYREAAYIPVPGDVPTIGFGTTGDVKMGDKITPTKALERSLANISKFEGAIKQCVKVPLYQREFDAYTSLSYNIGSGAFCGSTLVKRLNAGDYVGACEAILMWDKFKGAPLAGLTKRRQQEYRMCVGPQA